jgi:hypothetical protein
MIVKVIFIPEKFSFRNKSNRNYNSNKKINLYNKLKVKYLRILILKKFNYIKDKDKYLIDLLFLKMLLK